MKARLDFNGMGSRKIVIEEPKIYINPTFTVDGVHATDLYKIVYGKGTLSFDEQ